MDINNTFHTDHTSHEFAHSHSILQEPNRTIDDLRDTIRGWKIQYDRLYRQHMKLQRQSWCHTCRLRSQNEEDMELCLRCSRRIQKEYQDPLPVHSYIMPTSHYHIYSGGAIGIDEYAEQCAKECGMQMHVIIPPHHRRSKSITPLGQQDLDEAEPHLKRVAERTGKHLFTPNTLSRHLQLRNFHIIKPATIVYAFGYFQPMCNPLDGTNLTASHSIPLVSPIIPGGTGWTVQLAMDQQKQIYFYNIPEKRWYQYHANHCYWNEHRWTPFSGFLPMQGCPTLHKHSAVMGTRHPTTETLAEVKRLFQSTRLLEETGLLPEHGD